MADSIFINKNDLDKKFENQTFTNFIFEKDINTEGDILFYKCIFKNTFLLENITVRDLSFLDCSFEGIFYLANSSIHLGGFTNCDFFNDFNLTSNKCNSYFVLRNIKAKEVKIKGEYKSLQFVSSKINKLILQDINSEHSNRESKLEFLIENKIDDLRINSYPSLSNITFAGSEYNNVFFEGTFEESISFKKNVKIKNLHVDSSTFKKRIDFEEGQFDYVNFYRSIFQSLVLINDNSFLEPIPRDLQIKSLTIHSCSFEIDVSLRIGDIKDLNLSNNNFKQLFNFNNNANDINREVVNININGTNQGNIIIEHVYADLILGDINFGNIIFKDLYVSHLCMREFQNEGNVTFSNIKSGDYFTIQDSIIGNINFINFDVNIFREIVIANSTLTGVNFNKYPTNIQSYSKNPIMGYGISNKRKKYSNLKSVYNQLKHAAQSKGDIDMANQFQALEYRALLLSKKFGFDTFLLLFNWLSNDNGQSWFRGVIFTLSIGLLFFMIYLKAIGVSFNFNVSFL